jgi:pimeloyl-ACP methyl ester carboxylesterase
MKGSNTAMPYATRDGVRIHYQVEGQGEPLMLYHGLTGSGERWRDTGYTTGLGGEYQLILIDARGHGLSDKPRNPSAYSRFEQATDVVAVLDDLGIITTRFWGHSMGGDVALALGRHEPERVSALVITGYSPFAAEGEEATEMAAWADDLQQGITGFVAGYERRHGTLPEDARARWLANDGEALAACVANMIAESDGSQVADLPLIETPTLHRRTVRRPSAPDRQTAAARTIRAAGRPRSRANLLPQRPPPPPRPPILSYRAPMTEGVSRSLFGHVSSVRVTTGVAELAPAATR